MEGKKYKCGREHQLDRNSNIDLTAIISKTMQWVEPVETLANFFTTIFTQRL